MEIRSESSVSGQVKPERNYSLELNASGFRRLRKRIVSSSTSLPSSKKPTYHHKRSQPNVVSTQRELRTKKRRISSESSTADNVTDLADIKPPTNDKLFESKLDSSSDISHKKNTKNSSKNEQTIRNISLYKHSFKMNNTKLPVESYLRNASRGINCFETIIDNRQYVKTVSKSWLIQVGKDGTAGLWLVLMMLMLVGGCAAKYHQSAYDEMPHNEVEGWATTMGNHLSTLVDTVTKFQVIKERYAREKATVRQIDGVSLVKEMSKDVKNMMSYKLQAVRRIMNVAEESFKDSASKGHGGDNKNLRYINAKKINLYYSEGDYKDQLVEGGTVMNLTSNGHFDDMEVNTHMSSIHVPTNVYDRSPHVLDAIRWSETLDRTFISNYELDPTLHWQYFGSSVGFLRQYPASAWELSEEEPDLYDSRLRSWYIRAANTPKDMIILLDISGSMTGLRQEIAKHVVLNILDTLNENDFVNIFTFSDFTIELVPCFNDTLVQANLENKGEFKMALANIKPEKIANFSQALTKAFILLTKHNENGQGSQCNQAIMLITDGAPHSHQDVFSEFNWPQRQVRMFTYLIGREVTDIGQLRWMACANKGYYAHVSTKAEVREKVLKYIPVIARPLVMYRNEHPHIWTGVYADVAHEERGYVVTQEFGRRKILRIAVRPEKVFGRRNKLGNKSGYKLMTSVSVPVFDLNDTSVRTANLLGVAGTDVPIEEIQKLVPPYKLGVNGYSFIVNQNGHILYHPDLRPVHEESNAEFQDILKPNYNSVDLNEVELVSGSEDEYNDPRYNHSKFMEMRQQMINQQFYYDNFEVKIHLDDMKRVVVRKQEYHAAPIDETPFSLGIALPSVSRPYEVVGEIELSREHDNVSAFFKNESWNVHPEWVYCEYKYEQPLDAPHRQSPEALLLHFLGKAQNPGWRWSSTRTNQPPDASPETCDKELVQSLLFDAQVTDVYNMSNNHTSTSYNQDYHARSGINTAFVATRSGLTRWQDTSDKPPSKNNETHFMEMNNKAIDEIWYKRAVDYYHQDPDAYVYSVPFDAGTRDPSEVLMTVSRAVYIRKNEYMAAPAAVVGVTITLEKFIDYFKNETKKCSSSGCKKSKTCASVDLDCYLLDDSGFIVASEKNENTGRFFGEIEGTIMNSLVMSEVYSPVKVFDYQAVCLDIARESSLASILLNPIELLKWTVRWMTTNFIWLMIHTQLYQMWNPNEAWAYTYGANQQYPDFLEPEMGQPSFPSPIGEGNEFEPPGDTVVVRATEERKVQRDYNVRSRREAETIVEIVKSDEDPYDIAADYDFVIANVSINEDDNDFYNLTGTGVEEATADYAELTEGADRDPQGTYVDYVSEDTGGDDYDEGAEDYGQPGEMEGFPKLELAYINKTRPRPCDKEVVLYILNNDKLRDNDGEYKPVKGKLSNCHTNGCGRPFSVQKIMKTNLVLIVVNNRCPCDSRTVSIEPNEIRYNDTMHCQHLLTSNYRKRPANCFSYHPDEEQIKICGACEFGPSILGLLTALLFNLMLNKIR